MSVFAPQIVGAGLVAVFIIAFSKGAFGGGLAVVGIPILALVMDPVDAAIVLAPLLPAIPFGAYAGKALHDRIDRDRLFRIVYALILPAGAKVLGSSLGLIP